MGKDFDANGAAYTVSRNGRGYRRGCGTHVCDDGLVRIPDLHLQNLSGGKQFD